MSLRVRLARVLALCLLACPVALPGLAEDAPDAPALEVGDSEEAPPEAADTTSRGADPRQYRGKLQAGTHRKPTTTEPAPQSAPEAGPGDAGRADVPRHPALRIGGNRQGQTTDAAESAPAPPVPLARPPRPTTAAPDSPPTPTAATPPRPRPARNWKQKPIGEDQLPQPGDIVPIGRTGKKNLAVVKQLGSGAWGDVFVVEDQAGELSILKQQKAWPKRAPEGTADPFGEYTTRVDTYRKRAGAGNAKVLEPDELVKQAAKHEVDMQNLAARKLGVLRTQGRDVGDFVDPAELVGRGRIKQKYAGASFGDLMQDVDALADEGVKEASVRSLMKKMLQAADALDAVDMVHRDLHTGNIALDGSGQAKLLDFGLAKRKSDPDVQLEMTSGIGAGGTYGAAMPPETLRALRLATGRKSTPEQVAEASRFASGHKADVYSIGEVLGKQIDPNRAFQPLLKAPRKELIDLLDDLRADDPDRRPTAAQALKRLEQLETGQESTAEAQLQGFARQRMARALAEPAPSTLAAGSP